MGVSEGALDKEIEGLSVRVGVMVGVTEEVPETDIVGVSFPDGEIEGTGVNELDGITVGVTE